MNTRRPTKHEQVTARRVAYLREGKGIIREMKGLIAVVGLLILIGMGKLSIVACVSLVYKWLNIK